MASVSEESYGSLPPAQRAALELAKHALLHHHSGPTDNAHETDEQQQQAASYFSHDDARKGRPLTLPDNIDVRQTAPPASSNKRPRLSSSNSAPAAEMEAMAESTQGPRGSIGIAKAASFTGGAGHYAHGGDTQPVDSQVYHRYTESMRDEATTTTPRELQSVDGTSPETMATDREHTPQQTLQPGQVGYVDLDGMWEDKPVSPATSFANYDELLAGDGAKSPDTQFYQPHKPTMPETPALAGQKHGRDGEPLTSVTTATKYSQILPRGVVMGATQLFAQTQEHSSPFAEGQPSDDAMTRPSPNTDGPGTNGMSSPRTMLSSPVIARHVTSSSGVAEPRAEYTSMKESQEQRERRMRERLQQEGRIDAMDSDSDDDTQQRRFRAKQLRRSRSEQALKEAARVSAPPRGVKLPSSTRKSVVDLVTPATVRRKVSFDDILEEAAEDEGQNVLPKEPSNGNEDAENAAEQQEDDDQYDELQEKVIRSQSNFQDDEDDASIVGSIQENGIEVPDNDELLEDTQDPDDTGTVVEDDDLEEHRDAIRNTQRSTIADSQPLGQTPAMKPIPTPPTHHSSMASFIPGSQYTGKTSQDQVFLKFSHPSQIRVVASQPNEADKVPSSPPLPKSVVNFPENHDDPALHVQKLSQFQRKSTREDSATPQEVPESDAADPAVQEPHPDAHWIGRGDEESHNPIPFSTAQTHVSVSTRSPNKSFVAPSPLKAFRSQQNETPRKAFRDMIDGPQTANASFDFGDVDDIMAGVMTKEDEEVLDVLSTPRSKRRRTFHSSPASSKLRSENAQSYQPHHVNKDMQSNTLNHSNTPIQDLQTGFARSALPVKENVHQRARGVGFANSVAASEGGGTIPESEPDFVPSVSRDAVLRDSPNKANVLPTSPREKARKTRSVTPDSVEQREDEGSRHVSQLITTTRSAVHAPKKGKLKTFGRAARRRSDQAKKSAKQKSSRLEPRRNGKIEDEKADKDVEMEESAKEADVVDDINRNDATPPPAERVHQAGIELAISDVGDGAAEDTGVQEDPDGSLSAPERVWALFRGTPPNFYPATWIGNDPDGMSYKIRFDDNKVTSIDAWHVRTLTLRIGDQVKVDNGVGSRSTTWRVVAFGAAVGDTNVRALGSDASGHTHIKVKATSNRQRIPKDGTIADDSDEIREVLVSDLYLTNGMWKNYKDRTFNPPAIARPMTSGPGTPSSRMQTPDGEITFSRSHRSGPLITKSKKNLGSCHLRDLSVTSSTSPSSAAVFSGMAFAITYISDDTEKAQVTRMILRNGGIILEEGFGELFDIPDICEPVASLSKKSPRKNNGDQQDEIGLHLKSKYVAYGFVALIADRHSRRAKYMQALALDLPTLSGRWIIDSLNEAKNSSLGRREMAPLPWGKYLLPAGESSFLGGATRSRIMLPYDASSSQLRVTVQSRPLLLNHDGVLIVAPKKDKAAWERRRTYAFLTLALGAGTVERVNDLQAAKHMIQADPQIWKWIYVDGKIDDALAQLCDKTIGGKKRRRASEAMYDDRAKLSVTDGHVTVVNDEFVVQSLILGALAD